ncbi:hypothetical protein FF80_00410 [Devosia sp. LC5]|uniref:hypothetical protein n=1 Tax=Devosia sp. LC5 TaxID=1502724 RepID=UPI0004E45496|nr:hypothetical protein [Devosia sp. LC5]KFC71793.1 hypothetical protein FF80_00410 [Devosia sp. LC5]
MSQSPQDYVRQHNLIRKYGFGLFLVVLAGIGSTLLGDHPSLVVLKVLVVIPIVMAFIFLPAIFDPTRSRTPFTPSFIERTALEGVLLAIAIAVFSWSPDSNVVRLLTVTIFVVMIYFGASMALARFRRS